MLRQLIFLLRLARAHGIARRYFVTNGFDGGLAMVGLISGFRVSREADLTVVISACLGTAIALSVSGLTSAYVSEAAERRRELRQLERAMIRNLDASSFGRAARWVPVAIAVVNGLAPLVVALGVVAPLWLAAAGVALPLDPIPAAMLAALAELFLLGAFLGRVGGGFWLWAGLRTLAIAIATSLLILALGG